LKVEAASWEIPPSCARSGYDFAEKASLLGRLFQQNLTTTAASIQLTMPHGTLYAVEAENDLVKISISDTSDGIGNNDGEAIQNDGAAIFPFHQKLSGNFENICRIDAEDKLFCWGSNVNGVLGLGNSSEQVTPILVPEST
jgi:alpha-tubulin suppressor-like RCC1 family protein